MRSGIYMILNLENGKYYIGSSINLDRRWIIHTNYLILNYHPNQYLQHAWNKYGNDAFQFTIIEIIEDATKEKLLQAEQNWINASNCCDHEIGYNLCITAGSSLGRKLTEEHKKKLSIKQSEQTKLKKSLATKGIPKSEIHKIKIGIGNRRFEKWPCPDAAQCRCRTCNDKRKITDKIRYDAKSREEKLKRSRQARKNMIGSRVRA